MSQIDTDNPLQYPLCWHSLHRPPSRPARNLDLRNQSSNGLHLKQAHFCSIAGCVGGSLPLISVVETGSAFLKNFPLVGKWDTQWRKGRIWNISSALCLPHFCTESLDIIHLEFFFKKILIIPVLSRDE